MFLYEYEYCLAESILNRKDTKKTRFPLLFSYTGTCQAFKLPLIGTCTYECWGARGGNGAGNSSSYLGGYPGYTIGTASFTKHTQIYTYVGGVGSRTNAGSIQGGSATAYNVGGWNGGGNSGNNSDRHIGAGGGGATDFRLRNCASTSQWNELGSLRSRIMVAGGAGGAGWDCNGGAGGGLTGGTGAGGSGYQTEIYANTGGGQTGTGSCTYYTISPGSTYVAEHCTESTSPYGTFGYARGGENYWWGGGAGGGWYGGVQGFGRSGSGGSSFISGHPGCYAVNQSTSTSTTTYHKSGTNKERYDDTYYFTGTSMTAGATNSPGGNNGYARITMVTPVNN